ncbi:M20 aminoacylase family protein [Cohaesibacter celericrescens]|uniref:Amidohydrolase n=1 Tax=Cohaesibacter celericrescens TaxID=2067669 RepID=A0A2N5XLM6_9HYPH|nr:M20 aminoacylase family protein [Cohaesibacter celericrescens]PLW75394.1 amidohydrolase [Cohaesibacter celericrescens]
MSDFATLSDFDAAKSELTTIRHHLHAHPELSGQEQNTAAFVAEKLEEWGYEVTRNIGGHGVVGRLRAGEGNRSIAIRADMDALPIQENTGHSYASQTPGVMHACGHDGHTTMLLGAAQYLARTKNFSGTLNLVFQPAEESIEASGARAMIADGLFERFPCDAIFGMHNHPGVAAGTILTRSGPMMAAADSVTITVNGKGGHASRPHLCIDPIVCVSAIVMALQTIVSRSIDSNEPAVVTVGTIHGGTASNVIAQEASISVSIRSFSAEVRALLKSRLVTIVETQCASWGATATIDFEAGHPVVVNAADETEFATSVCEELVGKGNVGECPLIPGSEDFANYLDHKPGCFIRLGNGEESAMLHNPGYDFNDESLTTGAALWARLTERFLR